MDKSVRLCLLLVILSISLLSQQEVNSQSHNHNQEEELTILLKIKKDWGNPPSINSWNPSSTLTHCEWTGIICDDIHGSVIGIQLIRMNIQDRIPPSICDLKNLTEIDLSENHIPGEFPISLYNCSKLQILDLSVNGLQGRIPDDIDRISSSLRSLKLGMNNFSGDIPASIGRFPYLERLQLFQNGFAGSFPPEIGNLTNLVELDLSYNDFSPSRIPSEFGKLNKLQQLVITGMNLMGEIPETINHLTNLTHLEMNYNRISGSIPAQITRARNLKVFNAVNNLFTGKIPVELTSLSRLETLSLDGNQLSGPIPSKIISWRSLMTLTISRNQISGELPPEIGALPELNHLDLSKNQISGELPPEICALPKLNHLDLSKNQISGELPQKISSLRNFIFLDLSENQISGEIPSEIGLLKFYFLNLSSNRLTGKVPGQFENKFEGSFLNNSGLCASRSESCNYRPSTKSSKFSPKLLVVIVGATLLVSILLVSFVIRYFCNRKPVQDIETWNLTSFQELDFTESGILSNLTDNNVIGSGGSGKVYRVPVNHSGHFVAVKKIWNEGKLDQKMEKQFQAEVQILGTIRHYNIVKLLCCISSKDSKLLVYEYMENDSLYQWIHEKNPQRFLNWPKRLQVAVGIAQGLSYMHNNCSSPIIHRDVKSSNILLDSNFKAKIADFGLAKMLANNQGEPNSASVVAGSFGYIAPEYAHTRKVNEKIDVYSFGVVLLELVTGREANKGDEYTNLAEWAWRQFQEVQSVDVLMDETVKEERYLEEMRMVFKLGIFCTDTLPSTRPSMKEVLQILLRHGPLPPTEESYSSSAGIQREEESRILTTTEY